MVDPSQTVQFFWVGKGEINGSGRLFLLCCGVVEAVVVNDAAGADSTAMVDDVVACSGD